MCDQCSAGPFENQLALVGHKTTSHAKKPVKRFKRPGVGSYTPVKAPATAGTPPVTLMQGPVTTPATPTTAPGTQTTETTTQGTVGTAVQLNTTVAQPPNTPVIEPDSGAVKAAEQVTLPVVPVVPVVEQATQVQQPVVPVTPPVTTPATTVTQGTQSGTKEELKAVDGASLASVKYTKLSGLIAKSLQDFKLQFEASFPKDDMAKAIEAAHCSIVDNKVVFTGG
jgi:hypothetical protein